MTNRYIAERREDRARMMRIRKERKRRKAKSAAAVVIAASLIVACIACMCVIGFTIADNVLPTPHALAATEVTKLGMTSSNGNMQIATQAQPQNAQAAFADEKASALHFYGRGKTSYGYDWDYSADNDIVKVSCDYNFSTQTYDLTVTSKAAGKANVTLFYFADNTTKVPVSFAVNIDADLNITQI